MIERHVSFEVHMGRTAEFERLFKEDYRPAMSAMPGFVKVELIREQEPPTCYLMVIRFETAEDTAAWRSSKEHEALKPRLKALHGERSLRVYDVIA